MMNAVFIPEIMERLLLFFPEIIREVMNWYLGKFREGSQVAIMLKVGLIFFHAGIRLLPDKIKVFPFKLGTEIFGFF